MSVSFVKLEIENVKYVVCGQVAVIKEVYTLLDKFMYHPFGLSCHMIYLPSCAILKLYLAVEYIFG